MSARSRWAPLLVALAAAIWSAPGWAEQQGYPGGHQQAWGPRFGRPQGDPGAPHRRIPLLPVDTKTRIRFWNDVMLSANALDHTPVAAGETRVFGEQIGPGRTARAFAIVQIAVFDAVNAIVGGYESYTDLDPVRKPTSIDAAIAQAAHDTLIAMYPSQEARFDDLLARDLRRIPNLPAKARGIILGWQAAAAILALRANDGAEIPEPEYGVDWFPSDRPGWWRQDPISQIPLALGAYWGQVKPFVMKSADQFRAPPAPAMTSAEYTAAFNEAKRLGGDGITTPTERNSDQTLAGIYWAYDGSPGLGTPPRLYNQIVVHIASRLPTSAAELARLLALVNVAMADASCECWETKYWYQFWRPITAIREADPEAGPTGDGDGNPDTIGEANWTPLGAPASNINAPNFTPPFPAYTSGHATFGACTFQTLRRFYKTDRIAFTFVSDELNGITRDNQGNVRPRAPRTFRTLSQAEEENGQSRVYLGIHWSFDKTVGIAKGREIANYVYDNAFTRTRR